jgi:hypothetical protein
MRKTNFNTHKTLGKLSVWFYSGEQWSKKFKCFRVIKTVKWFMINSIHNLKMSLLQPSAHCEASFPLVLTVFMSIIWTFRTTHLDTTVTEHINPSSRAQLLWMHTCVGASCISGPSTCRSYGTQKPTSCCQIQRHSASNVEQHSSSERDEQINRTGIVQCVCVTGYTPDARGHHNVQTGSVAHPASYPVTIKALFSDKMTGTWSWPFICIWYRIYECFWLHVRCTPSWCSSRALDRHLWGSVALSLCCKCDPYKVGFGVLMAVSTKMAVFWVVDESHRPDDGGSKDLWNVGKLLPDYTVLQPRRQPSSWPLQFTVFLHS